jgi:hypothetical protein
MNSYYGYITGEYDVHPENDVVTEIATINDQGDVEYILCLETIRDVTQLNVVLFPSALELSKFTTRNGVIEQ